MEEADENEAIVYADIGESALERTSRSVPLSNPRPRDAGDHSPEPSRHDPEAVRRVPRCCQPEELVCATTPLHKARMSAMSLFPHSSCMHRCRMVGSVM